MDPFQYYRLDIVIPEIIGDACSLRGDRLIKSVGNMPMLSSAKIIKVSVGGALSQVGTGMSIVSISLQVAEGDDPNEICKSVCSSACSLLAGYLVGVALGGVALGFGTTLAITAATGVGAAWAGEKLWVAMNKVQFQDSGNVSSDGSSVTSMPSTHVDWLTAQTTHQRRDPVALDLDGDGVEFIRKGTHFDYDNNSFAELSSRLSADDGWLVRDVNGDGAINNGAELFGDATVLKDGSLSPDGFTALSEYDTNKDGIISASEAAAANIKVWRDINGDSVSDAGELFAFDQLGISQLNLKNTAASNAEQGVGGETLRQTGTYQKTDGSFGAMNGYFLEQVTYDTIAADSTEVVPHW